MGTQPHSAHSFTYQWPLCIRTELSGCDRLYVLQTQKYLLYSSFFKKHKLFFFFNVYLFIWLHWVLVAAASLAVACRLSSCGVWT